MTADMFDALHRKMLLFIAILFTVISISGQTYSVSGKVIDADTHEPLPFVNIIVANSNSGGITDLDGKFVIQSEKEPKQLKFTYVGYSSVEIDVIFRNNILIEMRANAYELGEVIINPGENPAHRIIHNAVENKSINNPNNLNSYSFHSYNRFFVSPDMEQIRKKVAEVQDSTFMIYGDYFENRYLFLMESISKRIFLQPGFTQENIIASRVAGFSDPLFTLIMTQLQSFTFYDDMISISEKNYVNPVSKGAVEKYFFLLEDTLYEGTDSVFVISFRPMKGKNFDALKGLLYIHTDRWAIQNVIAEPARVEKGFGIRIQQQYQRTQKEKIWFPSQLNTDIIFNNVSLNNLELFGQGRSYLFEIEINPPLRKQDFSDAQVLFDNDDRSGNDLLLKYSNLYGSNKDSTTYFFLDSLSKENNFERLTGLFKVAFSGKIPVSIFDIPVLSIIDFNDFEGWRLGLGVETNNRLLKKFSVGGYAAYGLMDKAVKYGAHVQYINQNQRDLKIKVSYINDVTESGGRESYDFSVNLLDAAIYRTFLYDKMDYYKAFRYEISGKLFRFTHAYATYTMLDIQPGDRYVFGNTTGDIFIGKNKFNADLLSLGVKYDPNIKTIKGLDYQIALVSRTPKPVIMIELQSGIGNSGENFYSLDFCFHKKFYTKYMGTTDLMINPGFVDRAVPYPFMRVIPAAYRKFNIYIPYSFLTVRMNEFVSDKYVFTFLSHDFGKLLFRSKNFSPGFTVAINGAWGTIEKPEFHRNRPMNAPEKGLFEGGIIIDNLLNVNLFSFGFATFYRFGAYSFVHETENVSFMISLRSDL
jgi:hypothetical protein